MAEDVRNVFDQEGTEATEAQSPSDDRKTIFLPGVDFEVETGDSGIYIKGHFSETVLRTLAYLVVRENSSHTAWPAYDH